jgi:autotransporter family porin
VAENKSANRVYNRSTGQPVGPGFFPAADSALAGQLLAPRINGDFTGTTQEILRWAACKWGISQNIVFAQAAVQSWWQQGTLGDWGTNPRSCPAGHGLGADGRPGRCPQRYGILQNRYPDERSGWPGIADSTAMSADAAYAVWRSCYDGYEVWLNNKPRGQQYQAGDVWGCVGRWFTGRWHTAAAQRYIASVREYLRERIWAQPYFKQTT